MPSHSDRFRRRDRLAASRPGGALSWVMRYRRQWFGFLVAVLLTFAVSEYFEASWLAKLSRAQPSVVQVIQGVSATLICALLLVWVMSGTSPSPLPTESSVEDWLSGACPDEQERLLAFARWFITVRWVAFAMAGILVMVGVHVARLLPREMSLPLLLSVVGLGVSNVVYRLLLRRHGGQQYFLLLQLYSDLGFFIAMLHFSGGIENPLSLLMVLHVIIGGTSLGRRQCYGVAAVATILLALLGWVEWHGKLDHRSLRFFPHFDIEGNVVHASHLGFYVLGLVGLHGVIFFVTAFFVSVLAERIRCDERQLAAVASRAIAVRHLLERSLETTGTGLRVLDTDLRPYWCNAEWLRWFAADHPADPITAEALAAREVRVAERTAPAAVGHGQSAPQHQHTERVLQLIAAPLLTGDGQISRIVELIQDITLQKGTQAQALRAGKLAAVGELAGQVAHEVNNPIGIISAKARLLLQDHGPEMSATVAQELRKIVDQSDRVARIAQGLLSYCRPSTGLRSPIPIHDPVRMAIGIIEQRARGRQVRIDDQLPAGLPFVVANSGEMQQVFLNLFLNALDAMPAGGVLGIRGRHANGSVELVVSDTGTGIPPEIRSRVFEPFVTTKEQGRGTGLGLSICLGLVRSHGGQMAVESQIGRGSSFTVTLPAAAAQPQQPE